MDGTLEITTMASCAVMCDYCPQHQLIKSAKQKGIHANSFGPKMTLETFCNCLSKVPKNIWIDFSGMSECFLNPDVVKMMTHAHNSGYRMRLYTTLTGVTPDIIQTLSDRLIKFELIVVHLPDNHNILKTKVDHNYIQTVAKLEEKYQFKCHVFGELHEKLRNAQREGVIKLHNIEYKSLTEHLITRANNTRNTSRVFIPERARHKGQIKCRPILEKGGDKYNHNVLYINGDVYLCCCDYALKHKLGNLLECEYEDLFVSEEYKRVMLGQTDDSIDILCRTCENGINIG